ncbi:MAG TPA: hypothetical protein VE398_00685, partial [Acidobacteriota bacterium]|nr:hypothetical protein [Acidobacteriota bacterium]
MKGIGRTCYQGTKPEEFQVEIIGVMKSITPGGSAVLARFSGGPLSETGVFEGMSGSPVYINGKLLGAVAFSFPFPKEAVGGITPITQMVDAFKEQGEYSNNPKVILKKSMLWDYRLPPARDLAQSDRVISPLDTQLQPALAPFGGHALIPIATPLSVGGFSPEALKLFAPQFKALGITLLQGVASTGWRGTGTPKDAGPADNTPIEPGSNIVIPLIRGDLDASAGGTVTYVDGDKLYAFGHLLFDLGFTELPMHKGNSLMVFPSLQSSFKLLETGDPIGTIKQDRGSGIYGILGEKARMIPLHVHLGTSRGIKKDLRFEVARDSFLTPFLINLTVYSSIVSTERAMGVQTLQVKGKIHIKDEQAVEIENRFSSDSNAPIFASMSIAVPVNFLLSSGYKNLNLENIDLDITSQEDDRQALLDSIRFDRTELSAGDAVELQLLYKRSNGEIIQDTYPVKIPSDVTPGPLSLLVADGTTLMSRDAREQGEELIPRDLSQLIKFINNIRKNDRLYIRL